MPRQRSAPFRNKGVRRGDARLAAAGQKPVAVGDRQPQGVYFSDYPGGRQDPVFVGSGSLSWNPRANVTLGAGVKFTQQLSTQSDLDWNGFAAFPQAQLNVKF